MPTECAVCYVSDLNFLLPTLVSAINLRAFVPAQKADVYIFVIDEPDRIPELNEFLKPHSISVLPLDSKTFGTFDEAGWNKTHVPPSALGRFFISDILPSGHKRILYLDGDTFVASDPSALIDFPIPEGRFAAVEDITYFCRNDMVGYGRTARPYFEELGIDGDKGYFNSGVFLVPAETWRTLAQEASRYFKSNVRKCRYHDQSALNAVVGGRRMQLSLAWNFQTPFRYLGVEKNVAPKIYHFTQHPKPWMGPVEPWSKMFPIYENAIRPLAHLNLPRNILSGDEVAATNRCDAHLRNKLKYIFPLRLLLRHRMVKSHDLASVRLKGE
jgi:lipopolysaccharide biosynthesis glycosyltransferase